MVPFLGVFEELSTFLAPKWSLAIQPFISGITNFTQIVHYSCKICLQAPWEAGPWRTDSP